MKTTATVGAIRDLRAIFDEGTLAGLSDGDLLDRFIARGTEGAFEALVRRHGPMVWGVCRRTLRDHHDAEDAFQAVFLVLARRAASVSPREMLPNWLHGVASRVARKARACAERRRGRESQVSSMQEPTGPPPSIGDDLSPLIDQELGRLPARYRLPILLCDLQGKTQREAAERLGWPVGTVSGRLSRGRSLLAVRLSRRGVGLTAGVLAALVAPGSASAVVPASLISSTTKSAARLVAGRAMAGAGVSAEAVALTGKVSKTMLMTKLKIAAAFLLVLALAGVVGTVSFDRGRQARASIEARAPLQAGQSDDPRVETSEDDGPGEAIDLPSELRKLEGTWAITELTLGEEKILPDKAKMGIGRVVIKGEKMTLKLIGQSADSPMTFSIDPTRSPKIMGLFPQTSEMEKDDADSPILLAIYELKGDTLRICFGMDRPDKFEAPPKSDRSLMVLKWAKK